MRDTLVPSLIAFLSAFGIVLLAYKVVAWWDYRADKEWAQKELPSSLDKLDKPEDPMLP